MPVNSTIRNADAPMTGGMICPPVEAAVSMAAAVSGLKPVRFIIGMVNEPVVTTFAFALPMIVPVMALAKTAAFAGPPRSLPAIDTESFT